MAMCEVFLDSFPGVNNSALPVPMATTVRLGACVRMMPRVPTSTVPASVLKDSRDTAVTSEVGVVKSISRNFTKTVRPEWGP